VAAARPRHEEISPTVFWKLATRDVLFASAALAAWWFFRHLTATEDVVGDIVGVMLGLALGATAFLLHEWGHLLGALAARSALTPAERLRTFYLFSFDSQRNSRRQFLIMSLGGFIATAAALSFAYAVMPDGQLASRVARGVIAFATLLTLVLEVPLVIYSLLRNAVPPVEVFAPDREAPSSAA
jgi:hypothetical protein